MPRLNEWVIIPRMSPKIRHIILSALFFVVSWALLYYAILYGQHVKDRYRLTGSDAWPGICMLMGAMFLIQCDTPASSQFMNAFSAYRTNGCWSPASARAIIGTVLGAGGFMWGLFIALSRFIMPLFPSDQIAKSALPGYFMIAHLLLLLAFSRELYEISQLG
jgi:hypothetical protein